jgi:hypothetical protein
VLKDILMQYADIEVTEWSGQLGTLRPKAAAPHLVVAVSNVGMKVSEVHYGEQPYDMCWWIVIAYAVSGFSSLKAVLSKLGPHTNARLDGELYVEGT